MARKPIIAGNWKMFKTASEAEALIADLAPRVADAPVDIVVCPPFPNLDRAGQALKGSSIALGAQNVFWEDEGAYTGEVAPGMLTDLGVRYAIVGHSERRQYFHEDDSMVSRRALAALRHAMTPIVCVGESLDQREAGRTGEVVSAQLKGSFAGFTKENALASVLAYEPVWAIGTGKVATPDQAQEVHHLLRGALSELFGADVGDAMRIQYGGSVKPENASELLGQADIDGALVGGASLKADSFAAIVRAAS